MTDPGTLAELNFVETIVDQGSTSIDLTDCDREPIHLPGAIQPHGVLLIADCASLKIIGAAGAVESRLAPEWLGCALDSVLQQDLAPNVAKLTSGTTMVAVLEPVQGVSKPFDATMRVANGSLIVELEASTAAAARGSQMLSALDEISESFDSAPDLKSLFTLAAAAFRKLTGFDRVMIYQFFDNEAGAVVAEDQVDELRSFLNHHFPASDVPQQARALYVRNRVRVIPDVDYQPAAIRPGDDWRDLDMSDIALRSVSPRHIQYLKNMDVAASASISIVREGALWGLVACHHRTPRSLSYETRVNCTTLAGVLARQIREKDDAENFRQRVRLRAQEDAIVAHLGTINSLANFLADCGEDLCRMFAADGFAAVQGTDIYLAGKCVAARDVRALVTWVGTQARLQPFSTDRLGQICPSAKRLQPLASGLLAVTLIAEAPITLMWFRAEQLEVVNWAGNPHKEVRHDDKAVLTPRASFAAWSETVSGKSLPWTPPEVDAVKRLSQAILHVWQHRRLRALNQELIATIADNQSLLVEKDFLIKEVHHRVQNSLGLVSAFLGIQAQAVGNDALTVELGEAQRRLSAVALVHRRLYSGMQLLTVDLARYLEDLCTDMMSSMGENWGGLVSFDLASVIVPTDRAVNVGLILTELLINAQKYAYSGAAGPITVDLSQNDHDFRLIIADCGRGITRSREGFGTRMLNAMIKKLDGSIEYGDNEPGLRVSITASVNEPRH